MAKKLYGTDPDQVPTNADLGTMAYQNAEDISIGKLSFKSGLSQQEWVGEYGALNSSANFDLFTIKNQYDNLCYELDVWFNIGSYHATMYRGVFGYSGFTEAVATGQTSYIDLSSTGTLYNEDMTITNNGGSNIVGMYISLRVFGYGVASSRSQGGADLITSTVLTRIR
jgi:hypothetical protein